MIKTKFQIHYLIIIFILICVVPNSVAQNEIHGISQAGSYTNIHFKNIEDQGIKAAFINVYNRFSTLNEFDITLEQKKIKASTMQAQPVFSLKSFFTGKKKYRIKLTLYVKDSDSILVSQLPDDVMAGWFAHELGHVVDYASRSSFGMIIYGLRYVFSEKFKRSVEHTADSIAVVNGFAPRIIAMKRFILENDSLSDDYKFIINKYYMSIDDVEIFMDEDRAPVFSNSEL